MIIGSCCCCCSMQVVENSTVIGNKEVVRRWHYLNVKDKIQAGDILFDLDWEKGCPWLTVVKEGDSIIGRPYITSEMGLVRRFIS